MYVGCSPGTLHPLKHPVLGTHSGCTEVWFGFAESPKNEDKYHLSGEKIIVQETLMHSYPIYSARHLVHDLWVSSSVNQ